MINQIITHYKIWDQIVFHTINLKTIDKILGDFI